MKIHWLNTFSIVCISTDEWTQHIPVAQSYYIHITAHFCMNPLQNRKDAGWTTRWQTLTRAWLCWIVFRVYIQIHTRVAFLWDSGAQLLVLQYSHQSSESSHVEQPLSSHHTTRAQPLIRPANEIHPNGCLKWELRKRVGEQHRLVEGLHSNRTV